MKNLSALQKCILILGTKQELVTPADVKIAYYKFHQRRYPLWRPSSLIFSVAEIGLNRYRAASVSISRSFATLARKGIVIRSYHGISLTTKGREVAKETSFL